MADPLNISVSGLISFQRALTTISHNITNANTDGFTRQRVELMSRFPQRYGNGFIGQGVFVNTIERVRDEFLNLQLQQNISESNRLDMFHLLSTQVDNLLSDDQGSIAAVLQEFFNGVNEVADDPSSLSARTLLLGAADSLVQRFQFLGEQLGSRQRTLNAEVGEMVDQVNSLAVSISNLNRQIVLANSQNIGHPANDLLDQREALINKLAEYIGVSTIEQSNGAMNVMIGNGQSLVIGDQYRSLTTVQNPENFTQLQIAYQSGSGTLSIGDHLTGGKIGGLLDYRRNILNVTQNELGRIAMVLADTFNDQHNEGMTLNNTLGGNFFNVPTPTTIINTNNTGSASVNVTATDYTALTASDYRLFYDGANFTLTRLSDNASVTGPGPFAMDGLSITIGAGANANDSYLIRPTANGINTISVAVTDPREIAAASAIRTSSLLSNISDAVISQGAVTDATNADLLDTVEIVFDNPPTTFDVLNITDASTIASNVVYSSGGTISFNGIDVQISGTPVAGDTFRIEQNVGGSSDNRNALLLVDLQAQSFIGGSTSYQQAFAGLVGQVGTQTNQAYVNSIAQNNLLTQAHEARNNVSGVNLDEEAANLLRYQQAYQAAAQVISTTNDLFQVLLGATD